MLEDVISAPTDADLEGIEVDADEIESLERDDEVDAEVPTDDVDIDAEDDLDDEDDLGEEKPTAPKSKDGQPTDKNIPAAGAKPGVGQPFTFTHKGVPVPFEGAVYTPGVGVTVPEAKIQELQRQLSAGREYGFARANHAKEVAAIKQEAAGEVARARGASSKGMQELFRIARLVSEDPDKAWAELVGFSEELPNLEKRADLEYREQQIKRQEEASQPTQAEVAEHRHSLKSQGYREVFQELAGAEQFKTTFGDEDWKDFQTYAEELGENLLEYSDEHGYVFRDDLLINYAKNRAAVIARERSKVDEAVKVAARNARKKAAARAVPDVPAQKTRQPRKGNGSPAKQTREEYEQYIRSNQA